METFLKVLDPNDSSAGGGSASAIAGAMAGALMAMVARLSRPAAGSAASGDAPAFDNLAVRAMLLSDRLREGAREDTEAFQSVRDAYRLPKGTATEKAERQEAIQAAWISATTTPLENAKRCLAVLELASALHGTVNPKVYSDYTCGLYLARAGIHGCLDNVAINLPSLKNAEVAVPIAAMATGYRSRCEELSSRLVPPGV